MDTQRYFLTEDQMVFHETVKRFCDKRIAPQAAEIDRTQVVSRDI